MQEVGKMTKPSLIVFFDFIIFVLQIHHGDDFDEPQPLLTEFLTRWKQKKGAKGITLLGWSMERYFRDCVAAGIK
jgi:hypothetical protein